MIGQTSLIEKLKKSKARSILITGPSHFGKKTLLREFLSKDEDVFEVTGSSNDFRDSVYRMYTIVRPTTYIIPDLDKRHLTAQNLLLKVIEEPPLKSRFFITASGGILPTITSRCVSYRVVPYTSEELISFSELRNIENPKLTIAKSPGQLLLLDDFNLSGCILSLSELKTDMDSNHQTLANSLRKFREINKEWSIANISHEAFVLVVAEIFGSKSKAVEWLRQQPEDAGRYVRTQFIMKYWLERQEMV